MKVTLWTMASDTDFGTTAEIFTSEQDADVARISASISDQVEATKAIELYDAGEQDEAERMVEEAMKGSVDTYSIEKHEVDIPDSVIEAARRPV